MILQIEVGEHVHSYSFTPLSMYSWHQAFYDLQVQLVSGQMLREYLALLHGTWPSRTQLETLQVPQVERPTRSGGRGKPSRSYGSQSRGRKMRRFMKIPMVDG